jgi:protein TonB
MPPTLKDSDLSSPETAAIRPASSGSPQTVALEVPVTVNGVRPVDHSDKREPFAEATKTVLVHSAGAVIRLASAVVPGQLLFLTNDKTKKEVVCQVVKSKSHGNVSGYVELQFTEAVQGFWGMGFPAERSAGSSATTRPPVLSPLGQNMELRPPISNSLAKSTDSSGSVPENEFKTEIKQDARHMSKADFLTSAESSTLKIETSRLQEQLSSLLFAEPASETSSAPSTPTSGAGTLSDATAKVFEIATQEPAANKSRPEPTDPAAHTIPQPKPPASTSPAFDAEEVKIPAWLEPLARNAAVPAPRSSTSSSSTSSSTSSEFEELSATEPQQPAPASPTRATASTCRAAVATPPVFGRTLLGAAASAPAKTPSGNKKILITAIAAGIVLAIAGVTWYLHQSSDPLANAEATNSSALSTPTALRPPATAPNSATNSTPSSIMNEVIRENSSADAASKSAASGSDTRAVPPSSSPARLQPAAISERVPQPAAPAYASNPPSSSTEEAEPEIARPSLGRVRLAKPKVSRNARVPLNVNGDAAPTLEADSEQLPAGESSLSGGLLAGNANQPAAPAAVLPVGGDVVTARLISSVPPTYPAMARTQHVAGDVRVDALIGANGRVSSMKVVSGPTILHQAAMDALRQWKYQPATLDGKPVAMHLTVTIQFHLQ